MENWARPWLGRAVALAAVLVGLDLALGPGTFPSQPSSRSPGAAGKGPSGQVLSPLDFAEMGNDAAMAHLRTLDGGRPLRVMEATRSAVVRFRATALLRERPGQVTSRSSGVLVNGGRHVVLAGHALDTVMGKPDPELVVAMADGSVRHGKFPAIRGGAGGAPAGDWGLVELEGTPPEGCPSLPLGAMAAGATVIMLGYSGGLGVDPRGRVYPAEELFDAPLRPLAFVGRVSDAGSGRIEIIAGMQVGNGASGGAIIDLEGSLVGVMASANCRWQVGQVVETDGVVMRPSEPAGGSLVLEDPEVHLGFTGTPVDIFREFLKQRWKR